MAQKIARKKPISVSPGKFEKAYPPVQEVALQEVETPAQGAVPEKHNTHDDDLWNAAIANSMDAIRDLADRALADRRAGRTKKITFNRGFLP